MTNSESTANPVGGMMYSDHNKLELWAIKGPKWTMKTAVTAAPAAVITR